MAAALPRIRKVLYGVGDTGFSLTSTIVGAYFLIFLTDVVGIAAGVAGMAIFVGKSWDYVNDPLVGYISDRTRSRWGRRRPFLLFGFVPFALAFALLWWVPPIESRTMLVVYFAAALVIFDTAATFVYMPYFALTPELTLDYDERTSLTAWRMFFSIAASLAAFTIPTTIIRSFNPDNASRVLLMGVSFAVASALPLLLTFFGTRERTDLQPEHSPGLKESFRAALMNKPFVFSMAIFLFTWVSVTILQVMLLYFLKYCLGRESQSSLIMGTIFLVAILSLPVWERISRTKDKRIAYIAGIAFWAVVQLVLVTLNTGAPLPLIFALAGLAGIGVGAAHVLPWAIIPDAIEWDELHTGERHEGTFYSLVTLMQKIASSLAIPAAGFVLQFSGYVPNSPVQPSSAVLGIRILTGPVPAVLLVAGIVFAAVYPLDRRRHADVVRQLGERRTAS
jgi:glycoside/pentoside/hexuronide:cation symporter, GPH family